jgi:hypothetical protein
VVGSREQGHETSGSIKGGERLDFVGEHRLRKKYSDGWMVGFGFGFGFGLGLGLGWVGLVWFKLVGYTVGLSMPVLRCRVVL